MSFPPYEALTPEALTQEVNRAFNLEGDWRRERIAVGCDEVMREAACHRWPYPKEITIGTLLWLALTKLPERTHDGDLYGVLGNRVPFRVFRALVRNGETSRAVLEKVVRDHLNEVTDDWWELREAAITSEQAALIATLLLMVSERFEYHGEPGDRRDIEAQAVYWQWFSERRRVTENARKRPEKAQKRLRSKPS